MSFAWTRHRDGSWTWRGYRIKRDRPKGKWRLLRDEKFWDAIDKLPDAKRACEADFIRRSNDSLDRVESEKAERAQTFLRELNAILVE